ncbi:MAG: ParB/RepB/Spo0J family partition protein [Gemmatimonadaceae bacterium]|nr:ParB/RepB/Spo0J family partition protein [Gemmatimonadaceae bacterium]NUQ94947.1 ParB/RepB/Spo0J family partition protein [Gemmatimonadaceae bacterium]NUR18193.1 ParB/RepB/Spo0J family partition protein [Gemmatimonadaceae bacterium]
MSNDKQRRLGRGLEALINSAPTIPAPSPASAAPGGQLPYREIALGSIRPNRYQPRREFKPEELSELQASIKATGLLQPITVRPAGPDRYELIAGERRLRAATALGWEKIPAVVKDIDDRTALTLALVENLQRADLNPLEEAEGYQRLVDEFGMTQQQVADIVGKDRSTVANILRVLSLPASVRRLVAEGQLTLGHARALLALPNEREITAAANEIVARGLTVRDVERLARDGGKGKPARPDRGGVDTRPPEVRRIEDQLRKRLQTDVQVALAGKEKGELRIPFYSADDLERVLDLLLGTHRDVL